uniref:Uncharacterized protein n=1 Tax=Arundo donax TaxID=35708 RepID=A0A0A9BJ34_ARUDO
MACNTHAHPSCSHCHVNCPNLVVSNPKNSNQHHVWAVDHSACGRTTDHGDLRV